LSVLWLSSCCSSEPHLLPSNWQLACFVSSWIPFNVSLDTSCLVRLTTVDSDRLTKIKHFKPWSILRQACQVH
jgi:hypothetical protein